MTLYDDAQTLRAHLIKIGSSDARDAAEALIASVDELMEGSRAQCIGKLLTDENGLLYTQAALSVLATVLLSFDQFDEYWGEKNRPGSPSVTDYAAYAIESLQRRFSGPGMRL